MKFLVDMNLSPRWVEFLHHSGFESVHWSTVGELAAPDIELMDYAAKQGYVVITHDLDFGAILAVTHGEKPSVTFKSARKM